MPELPGGNRWLEEMGKLYEEAGRAIAGAMPSGWATAWTHVEMEHPDVMGCVCFVRVEELLRNVPPPIAAVDVFMKMWQLSRETDGDRGWTCLTFVLHAQGRFEVDYGYGPVPIEEAIARRKAWKAKYGLA